MGFFTRIVKAFKWAMTFLKDWRGPVETLVQLCMLVAEGSGLKGPSKKEIVKNAVRKLLPEAFKKYGLPAFLREREVLAWVDATIDATVYAWNQDGWPGEERAEDYGGLGGGVDSD